MDLTSAELHIVGRIAVASNLTLLCSLGAASAADASAADPSAEYAVYKPTRGEAPLWDFPDGTLAGREVASYRVAHALGWDLVPETVLRDGPLGPGMVQRWIGEIHPDTDDTDDYSEGDVADSGVESDGHLSGYDPVELFPVDGVPSGYLPVLTTYIEDDSAQHGISEVALAHADTPELQRLAVFDVVVNNADRKGGHIVSDPSASSGGFYGVDHGICLHTLPKLRTVLWGWAGERIPDELLADLARFADDPPDLTEFITEAEQQAMVDRARRLVERKSMPHPPGSRPIPWPPF